MPTRAAEPQQGVGSAAKQVADHAKALVGLELELAGLELKRKASSLGAGAGMAIAAAALGLFAFGFLLLALAAGLAELLPLWLSLLLVAGLLLAVAAVLGLVGRAKIRRGTPPVPKEAIAEAKRTTEALKSDGSQG